MPVREALPEVVEQGFVTLLDQVYRTGEPYIGKEIQVRLHRGDSGAELQTVLLDFVYQPIRDRSGAVAGIFVQGVDVTEHTANSERLRIAQEAGGIGSFEWFPDTDTMVCSDTYRRLWGLPDGIAVTGSMLVAMVSPEDRTRWGRESSANRKIRSNTRNTRSPAPTPARSAGWRGAARWSSARRRALPGRGVRRHPSQAIDQALRDSEARIQQSNEFIRLLLDSTEEGFYSIDRNGLTTLCNRAFMRMLGFSQASQVIGRRLHDLIHHSRADGTFYRREDCPIERTARPASRRWSTTKCSSGSTAAVFRWNTGRIRCAATARWKARCAPSPTSAPAPAANGHAARAQ